MKKKILVLVLLICVAVTLIACRSSAAKSAEETTAIKESEILTPAENEEEPVKLTTISASVAPDSTQDVVKSSENSFEAVSDPKITDSAVTSGTFCSSEGNGLKVEILSVERCKDYLGADCVQVKYNFTNDSSSVRDFQSAISTSAFQNGRELNKESPIYPDYSIAAAQAQPVASGDSLEVICYFPVQNYNDTLELRVGIFTGNPVQVINENSCTVSIP